MFKAFEYAAFIAEWIALGKPTRSVEKIKTIHQSICKPCEHYAPVDDEDGICTLCGCNLNDRTSTLNKLYFGNAECPIQKWSREK